MIEFCNDLEKKLAAAGVVVAAEGGVVDRLRLLKLLYIADRKSLCERGAPIIGGRVAALDNGPLHSDVYDLIKGSHLDFAKWSEHFRSNGYHVEMIGQGPRRDSLSDYEIETLFGVADQYRNIDTWELVQTTNCFREWLEAHRDGTSRPIPMESILKALGFSDEEIEQITNEAASRKRVLSAVT